MSTATQFCTFRLDHLTFGVGVDEVQEVIRAQQMTPVPRAPGVVEGLINLRGQIVTALDLRRRLELDPRPDGAEPMMVIVRAAQGELSLLVDEIGDVVEVDEEAFERAPQTLEGVGRELIVGAYKLEGRLLLVLDTARTVELVT